MKRYLLVVAVVVPLVAVFCPEAEPGDKSASPFKPILSPEAYKELTARSIGRKLAISLDGRVRTAPVIETRIPGGRARISLGSWADPETLKDEARDLVAVLRAGALPAPIHVVERR